MKKSYIAILASLLPMVASAQSAVDAMQVSQPDFKGTARYMSMGGAFSALGGDLSAINSNPGGIGVYRSSEIGVTLDINMQSTQMPNAASMSQTKVYCNNFGYVGATRLDGALRTFNWGVTYNRATSFDRVYNGYTPSARSSLSDYIADFSYGYKASDMWSEDWNKFDPYLDTNIDWLSILAYNTFLINPVGATSDGGNSYIGLSNDQTFNDAIYSVREQGYVDEYEITFGGNVEDVVYWGLGIGITDLNYKRWAFYSESLGNANVPADAEGNNLVNGSFKFDLDNFKYINGSGCNIKAGVILKPINELRIGLAVHTPTFYKLNTTYDAENSYVFTPTTLSGEALGSTTTGSEYTDNANYDWKLNSPWKLIVGVAGVIGNRAIISADYEFAGYNSMRVKVPYNYDAFGGFDFVSDDNVNADISDYWQNQSTVRLGVEYRITPQLSARAGYNARMSNVKDIAYNGQIEVLTSGTDPSYSMDHLTQHISCGLGYKYQNWYIDAAYVYKTRESRFQAYTNWDGFQAPVSQLKDHNSSIVLSTGFKF